MLALLVMGILSPADALAGLSNEGMVTVAVLYIVGAGVQRNGWRRLDCEGDVWAAAVAARARSFALVFPTIGLIRAS